MGRHRPDAFEGPTGHLRGHHRHHHGRRGNRLFDYGELRLLVLALIAEQPRHGYELIKAIEERMGGSYTPSPGVIYPTLSWLDDMGYASVSTDEPGRKSYHITTEGEAFLAENQVEADELLARGAGSGHRGRRDLPPTVTRAMENLKTAMRLRIRRGDIDEAAAAGIAAALDGAAHAVERS
jgi:DNA-binding PadR family transcriptional regulator